MWQSPNQRVRALAEARKRQKERMKNPFHVRRVLAELRSVNVPDAEVVGVRLLLNDISPKGVSLFATESVLVGMEVAITMHEPRRAYLRGRIISCHEFETECNIVSDRNYSYRIAIQFVFGSTEEEQAIHTYWEELNRDFLHGSKAA